VKIKALFKIKESRMKEGKLNGILKYKELTCQKYNTDVFYNFHGFVQSKTKSIFTTMLFSPYIYATIFCYIWIQGTTFALNPTRDIFFFDTTPGPSEDVTVSIEPEKGINFDLGFGLCFKVKFNTWTISTPFSSSVVQVGFGKLQDAVGYLSINKIWYLFMWPDGVKQSPYIWYDYCLSFTTAKWDAYLQICL